MIQFRENTLNFWLFHTPSLKSKLYHPVGTKSPDFRLNGPEFKSTQLRCVILDSLLCLSVPVFLFVQGNDDDPHLTRVGV